MKKQHKTQSLYFFIRQNEKKTIRNNHNNNNKKLHQLGVDAPNYLHNKKEHNVFFSFLFNATVFNPLFFDNLCFGFSFFLCKL